MTRLTVRPGHTLAREIDRHAALGKARSAVLEAAREWRAVMKPGVRASLGSMEGAEKNLAAAVDALVALESEGT